MNLDFLGQRLVADVFPRRRAAERKRQEARSLLAGCDYDGCLGARDFALRLRSVPMGEAQRGAKNERRQCETGFYDQDCWTDWYAL